MHLFFFLGLVSLSVVGATLVQNVSGRMTLPLAAAYVGGSFLLSFLRPRWGFVVFLFFLPVFNNTIFCARLGNFPPALVLFLSFFAGWMFNRIWRADAARVATPLNGPLLAYVILGLGSGLLTILRYSEFYPIVGRGFENITVNLLDETSGNAVVWAFRTLVVFLAGPAIFWATLHLVTNKRQVTQALTALAMGLALAVLFGLYQTLGHETLGNIPRFGELGRVNATFTDPNALGSFFILALPLVAGLLAVSRRAAGRALLAAVLAGGIYVLGCSGSRTGMGGVLIAFLVAGGLFLAHDEAPDLSRHSRLLLPALVLAIGLVAFFPLGRGNPSGGESILSQRLSTTFEAVQERGIVGMLRTQRWPMWKRALGVMADFPLSGIGLGAFHTEIPNFMKWGYRTPHFRDNANNFYLETSAEMGLIGLLFALVVLGIVIREAFRWSRRRFFSQSSAVLACLFCGALAAMVVMYVTGPHTLFAEVQLLTWVAIGMVFAQQYAIPARVEYPACAPPTGPLRPRLRHVLPTILAATLICVFLVNQAADALTVLSLNERRRLYDWESSYGFYTWEVGKTRERLRWTRNEAAVRVPLWRPLLHTTLFVGHPDAARDPVRVEIFLDGRVVRKEVFDRPDQARSITLLLPRTDKNDAEVGFRVSRTFVPARSGKDSLDTRELGVMVREFAFSNIPETGSYGLSDWQTDPGAGSFPFRTVNSVAALNVNPDRGSRFEILASAAPTPVGAADPRLHVYAGTRLLHEVTLDEPGWRKIVLDLKPGGEEPPTMLRFEVTAPENSLPETKYRPVRLTRLRPVVSR